MSAFRVIDGAGFRQAGFRQLGSGGASSSSSSSLSSLQASWSAWRYYLLDYTGGSDTNDGYIDGAAGLTIDPTGKAIKTAERLRAIMPSIGNGKNVAILVKNRADGSNYLKQDGVTEDRLDFSGVFGYGQFILRASSDLTNSTTDKFKLGHITSDAGPNADGSWTVASATNASLTVAAGTLPAETTIIGRRVRFKGNVSVGLANKCYYINDNTSSALSPGSNFSPTPAAGDEFFIEKPGAAFVGFVPPAYLNSIEVPVCVGFKFTGSASRDVYTGTTQIRFVACELSASTANSVLNGGGDTPRLVYIVNFYSDESGVLFTVGVGARSASPMTITAANEILTRGLAILNTGDSTFNARGGGSIIGGFGSYFAGRINVTGPVALGGNSTLCPRLVRLFGSVRLSTTNAIKTHVTAQRLSFSVASGSAFALSTVGHTITVNECSGTAADAAVDITTGVSNEVQWALSSANTIVGALGDVKTVGNVYTPFSQIANSDLIDTRSNRVVGSAGPGLTRMVNGIWGKLPMLAADPSAPTAGMAWIRSDTGQLCVYNGSATIRVTLT